MQGGFHELQNEPDGVKERLADEIVAFIEEHLLEPSASAEPPATEAAAEGSGVELTAETPLETPPPNVSEEGADKPVKANM